MKRIIVSFLLGMLTIVYACAWDPAYNPQSPDYPCGPRGKVCSGSYPNAICCWRGDTCGSGAAFSTCPAGYCCHDGDDDFVGARRPATWQTPAHEMPK